MSVYSPLFFFAVLLALLLLVATPLFAAADVPPTKQGRRVTTLDGARGFLALAVVYHHAIIYHDYLEHDRWQLPPSRFYSLLGQVGVAIFFMITGYLFWTKLLKEKGRPNWLLLYVGRVFRIAPLYLVAVLASIVAVFVHSRWVLYGTVFGLVKTCSVWLTLGVFGQGGDINHYDRTVRILAGVTWTLQYEWWFYAALLPLSLFAIRPAFARWSPPIAFAVLCVADAIVRPQASPAPPLVCCCFFCAGIATASLHQSGLVPDEGRNTRSAMAVLLLAGVFLFCPNTSGVGAVVMLSLAFLFVATGSDLFGILSRTGSMRLGDMSYSIYLLHGLVLDAVFSSPTIVRVALSSSAAYWLVILCCGALLVCVSTLSLVLIERPGVLLGRRVGSALLPRLAAVFPVLTRR